MAQPEEHPPESGVEEFVHDGFAQLLVLILVALLYSGLAPATWWARAIAVVLHLGVLFVALRRSRLALRTIIVILAAGVALSAVAVVVGVVGEHNGFVALVAFGIAGLVGGSMVGIGKRLVKHPTVSFDTVAGAICIYLLMGLFFTWMFVGAATVTTGPFLGGDVGPVTGFDYLYFSLAALTTTGFGDYVPLTDLGRILAVIEALFGQLYLVTVLAVLVANIGRSRPESRRRG